MWCNRIYGIVGKTFMWLLALKCSICQNITSNLKGGWSLAILSPAMSMLCSLGCIIVVHSYTGLLFDSPKSVANSTKFASILTSSRKCLWDIACPQKMAFMKWHLSNYSLLQNIERPTTFFLWLQNSLKQSDNVHWINTETGQCSFSICTCRKGSRLLTESL